jgi:ceramide glucosyltransferase
VTGLADAAALLACVGILQCALGFAAVRWFIRAARSDPGSGFSARYAGGPPPRPPVTILKPLCGGEPLLDLALKSCFAQEYPEFQIIFGVQDPDDPALAVLEQVRQDFPDRDIHVVVDPSMHGPNRKVSNLINMLPFARHEILVISDSDLHLPPNYLDGLVTELEKPGAGLVTTLYVGAPADDKNWAAALGATQINHQFLPGVLLSRAMGRQDCLGSTAMFRRETLERTGGFSALLQLLAEDNVLGQRVRDLGLTIQLADIVPSATVPEPSFWPLWRHEIRWTRTIRQLAPLSLVASTMQYPLFWSGLAFGLSGAALWSVSLFLASWFVRAICAIGVDYALRDRLVRRPVATPIKLLPIRDLLSVVQIFASFWVDQVTWRGHTMNASGVAAAPVRALGPVAGLGDAKPLAQEP